MILSFLIFAWLTFAVTLFTYAFVKGGVSEDIVNRLDRVVLQKAMALRRHVQSLVPRFALRLNAGRRITSRTIQRTVCLLSDQQLLTGMSIMIVGLLLRCSLTQYHATIVALLATMSFSIHESTVSITKNLLIQRRMHHWRGLCFLALFAMVVAVQVQVGSAFGPLMVWGLSAECVWRDIAAGYKQYAILRAYIALTLLYLSINFLNTMWLLFPGLMGWWFWLQRQLSKLVHLFILLHMRIARRHDNASHGSVKSYVWTPLRHSSYYLSVLVFTLNEFGGSSLFIFMRVFPLIIGTTGQVLRYRIKAPNNGLTDSEDRWGFGQILPLVMLVLPFISIIETWLGKSFYYYAVTSTCFLVANPPKGSGDEEAMIIPHAPLKEQKEEVNTGYSHEPGGPMVSVEINNEQTGYNSSGYKPASRHSNNYEHIENHMYPEHIHEPLDNDAADLGGRISRYSTQAPTLAADSRSLLSVGESSPTAYPRTSLGDSMQSGNLSRSSFARLNRSQGSIVPGINAPISSSSRSKEAWDFEQRLFESRAYRVWIYVLIFAYFGTIIGLEISITMSIK